MGEPPSIDSFHLHPKEVSSSLALFVKPENIIRPFPVDYHSQTVVKTVPQLLQQKRPNLNKANYNVSPYFHITKKRGGVIPSLRKLL